MRKLLIITTFFAICGLFGCASTVVNAPVALQERRLAITNDTKNPYWVTGVSRITASIQPESQVLFSVLSIDFVFQSIYRNYPDGSAKFVMFMAQGTRVGSCERNAEGALSCQQMPLPSVSDLVENSFLAIENLVASKPTNNDEWLLQKGDSFVGIDNSETVAVRKGPWVNSARAITVYGKKNTPLVVYKADNRNNIQWKMRFKETAGNDSICLYEYSSNTSNWKYNINIQDVK